MNFEQALNELINSKDLSFPSLNPDRGGASTDIKVNNKTVYFKRNKATQSVNIAELQLAYQVLSGKCASKKPSEWADHFKKGCAKTFFLQILVNFDLAEVNGKGVKGSPFVVRLK